MMPTAPTMPMTQTISMTPSVPTSVIRDDTKNDHDANDANVAIVPCALGAMLPKFPMMRMLLHIGAKCGNDAATPSIQILAVCVPVPLVAIRVPMVPMMRVVTMAPAMLNRASGVNEADDANHVTNTDGANDGRDTNDASDANSASLAR